MGPLSVPYHPSLGKKIKKRLTNVSLTWQRVIFTTAGVAIVTAKVLNFCVRDGYRCVHFAITTRSSRVDPSKPDNMICMISPFCD